MQKLNGLTAQEEPEQEPRGTTRASVAARVVDLDLMSRREPKTGVARDKHVHGSSTEGREKMNSDLNDREGTEGRSARPR